MEQNNGVGSAKVALRASPVMPAVGNGMKRNSDSVHTHLGPGGRLSRLSHSEHPSIAGAGIIAFSAATQYHNSSICKMNIVDLPLGHRCDKNIPAEPPHRLNLTP